MLSTIDRELLKPSASVALHKHSNALVDVLPPEADRYAVTKVKVSLSSCLVRSLFWPLMNDQILLTGELITVLSGISYEFNDINFMQ